MGDVDRLKEEVDAKVDFKVNHKEHWRMDKTKAKQRKVECS